jgi:hypothetical protein
MDVTKINKKFQRFWRNFGVGEVATSQK